MPSRVSARDATACSAARVGSAARPSRRARRAPALVERASAASARSSAEAEGGDRRCRRRRRRRLERAGAAPPPPPPPQHVRRPPRTHRPRRPPAAGMQGAPSPSSAIRPWRGESPPRTCGSRPSGSSGRCARAAAAGSPCCRWRRRPAAKPSRVILFSGLIEGLCESVLSMMMANARTYAASGFAIGPPGLAVK